MFILRTFDKKGVETNKQLGVQYSFIVREENAEAFRETYAKVFDKSHVADLDQDADFSNSNCLAFIIGEDEIIPIYRGEPSYIMSDNGCTFDNVTRK